MEVHFSDSEDQDNIYLKMLVIFGGRTCGPRSSGWEELLFTVEYMQDLNSSHMGTLKDFLRIFIKVMFNYYYI